MILKVQLFSSFLLLNGIVLDIVFCNKLKQSIQNHHQDCLRLRGLGKRIKIFSSLLTMPLYMPHGLFVVANYIWWPITRQI